MPNNLITIGHSPVVLIIRLINYAVSIIEFLLGLRFFLRFAGANAGNGFVAFIYQFSDLFLAPFRSIFPRSVIEGSVLEWSTLFAMALYGIIGYALVQLILILTKKQELVEVDVEPLDIDTLKDM